uniref:Uncharacterized protein n=2 Tax=uncultured virus TaxID=340016 RepID=V5KEA8_9VIRU|nr:hypothetical protein [uncultured virus]
MPRECNGLKPICDSFPLIYSQAVVMIMRNNIEKQNCGRCISAISFGIAPENKNTESLQRSVILKLIAGSASMTTINAYLKALRDGTKWAIPLKIGLMGGSDSEDSLSSVELSIPSTSSSSSIPNSSSESEEEVDESEVVIDEDVEDKFDKAEDEDVGSEFSGIVDKIDVEVEDEPLMWFTELFALTLQENEVDDEEELKIEQVLDLMEKRAQEEYGIALNEFIAMDKALDQFQAEIEKNKTAGNKISKEDTNALAKMAKDRADWEIISKNLKVNRDVITNNKKDLANNSHVKQVYEVLTSSKMQVDKKRAKEIDRKLSETRLNKESISYLMKYPELASAIHDLQRSDSRINIDVLNKYLSKHENRTKDDLKVLCDQITYKQAASIVRANNNLKMFAIIPSATGIKVVPKDLDKMSSSELAAARDKRDYDHVNFKDSVLHKEKTAYLVQQVYNKIDEHLNKINKMNKATTSSKDKTRISEFNKKIQSRLLGEETPKTKIRSLKNPIEGNKDQPKSRDRVADIIKKYRSESYKPVTPTVKLVKESRKQARENLSKAKEDAVKLMSSKSGKPESVDKKANDFKSFVKSKLAIDARNKKDEVIQKHNEKVDKITAKRGASKEVANRMRRVTQIRSVRSAVRRGQMPETKFIKKVGNHSVHVNGIIEAELDPKLSNVGQNAFAWCRARVFDVRDKVRWCDRSWTWQVHSTAFQRYVHGRMTTKEYVLAWDRWTVPAALPERTVIQFTAAEFKDRLDANTATDYIKSGGVIQGKNTADTLMTQLEISKQTAESIACKISNNLTRHNNKALFAQGIILATMLHDFELSGQRWKYSYGEINNVMAVNLTPPPGQIHELGNKIDQINSQGAFAFDRRYISDIDISIMSLLSSGTGGIETDGGALNHIFQSFEFGNPKFAVYGKGLTRDNFNLRPVTSHQILTFLKSMAKNMNMKSDYVEGALLATRIMNGQAKANGVTEVFYGCTLECKKYEMPKPFAHNFLWRVINQEPKEKMNEHLQSDWEELEQMEMDEVQTTCALLAALMSAGVSTVLHKYNITGSCLIDIHAYEIRMPTVHPIIRALTDIHEQKDRAAMFCLMSAVVAQISGCNINSSAFTASPWCASYSWVDRGFRRNVYWMAVWKNKIPYLFDPIILGPYCHAMPAEWALSKPGMGIDLQNECVIRGAAEIIGWYATAGEKKYDENIAAGKPFLFVCYAPCVLNFILQHEPYNVREPFHLNYEIRQGTGSRILTTNILVDADLQPEMDMDMPHIIPGTLLSYDWESEQQMAPVIYATDLPHGSFMIFSSTAVKHSEYAGIDFERIVADPIAIPTSAVANLFGDMSIFEVKDKTSGSARKFKKSEN